MAILSGSRARIPVEESRLHRESLEALPSVSSRYSEHTSLLATSHLYRYDLHRFSRQYREGHWYPKSRQKSPTILAVFPVSVFSCCSLGLVRAIFLLIGLLVMIYVWFWVPIIFITARHPENVTAGLAKHSGMTYATLRSWISNTQVFQGHTIGRIKFAYTPPQSWDFAACWQSGNICLTAFRYVVMLAIIFLLLTSFRCYSKGKAQTLCYVLISNLFLDFCVFFTRLVLIFTNPELLWPDIYSLSQTAEGKQNVGRWLVAAGAGAMVLTWFLGCLVRRFIELNQRIVETLMQRGDLKSLAVV